MNFSHNNEAWSFSLKFRKIIILLNAINNLKAYFTHLTINRIKNLKNLNRRDFPVLKLKSIKV